MPALPSTRCAYFIHVGINPDVSAKGLMVALRN